MTIRLFALAAIGVTTFAATMTFETSNANAVVYCVEGVYRAGCVVRPGVAPVRGVARRTTRRVVRRRSDMTVMPAAVVRGSDGYLRVFYDKLGLKFQTYEQWVASGAHVPAGAPVGH